MTTEVTVLEKEALTISEAAQAITIKTPQDYISAGEAYVGLKNRLKAIDSVFDPPIAAGLNAHRTALAAKKKVADPFTGAAKIIDDKLKRFRLEREAEKREKELKIQAEQKRQEEERRIREAEIAEEMGDHEQANEIISQPVESAPVILPDDTPKMKGVPTAKYWKFKIVDADKVKREYLMTDDVKIRKQVIALGKDAEELVGGILAWQE